VCEKNHFLAAKFFWKIRTVFFFGGQFYEYAILGHMYLHISRVKNFKDQNRQMCKCALSLIVVPLRIIYNFRPNFQVNFFCKSFLYETVSNVGQLLSAN
jgi:hypothetical protein